MSDDAEVRAHSGTFPEPDRTEPADAAGPMEMADDARPMETRVADAAGPMETRAADDAGPPPSQAPAPGGVQEELAAPAPADPAEPLPSAGTQAWPGARPIAPREYYSISEVCELVGLKPHVLRYWESQFPVLNPSKNRSGNRVYQRKEIKLILLVQHLLYKEKYTIEGARQRLDQLRRGGKAGELAQATSHAVDAEIRTLLRDELQQLLEVLAPRGERRPGVAPETAPPAQGGRAAE